MSVKRTKVTARILGLTAGVWLLAPMVIAGDCFFGTYDAVSIDGTQGVLPDETDETLLPLCSQWTATGVSLTLLQDDVRAGNGKALGIYDATHAEFRGFRRETAFLGGAYAANTASLTARLRVDPPSGGPEFMGGTLGVFMEIDDGMSRIYMNLLNEDFAGGADPMVGIAGSGALNQSSTYSSVTAYWDDGAYHTFELTRNSDGSATLVVDGGVSGVLNVPAGSLQPTRGVPGFAFGTAAGGISTAYWDNVSWAVGHEDTKQVAIDIRPRSKRNVIPRRQSGVLPVAVLSAEDFNAPRDLDLRSLTFGHTGDEKSLAHCQRWWRRDVNRDGLKDQVCYFWVRKAAFEAGDTEAVLRGLTKDGVKVEGRDQVVIRNW